MKRHLPPLNALRAFEAAARLGRMSAAAEELSVTPGAISRQVRQLEKSLSTRLFDGPKNNPQLTTAARKLLPTLSAAFDQMEAALLGIHHEESGTLDIACFGTFTMKWLIPRLHSFNTKFPEIRIRLATSDDTTDVRRHDLVITASDAKEVNGETVFPLFPERLGPVMAPSLASKYKLRSAKDLAGKTLLHTKTRPNAWQMWCDSLGCTIEIPTGPTYEHYYFTLEAAIGGLGVCIAP